MYISLKTSFYRYKNKVSLIIKESINNIIIKE